MGAGWFSALPTLDQGPGMELTVLACRLYRDQDGSLHGVPSVPALRRALKHARDNG